ncbi:MAG: hypothetical protein DMF95_15460 [Acidobacteria bacterium]|nr:MAG: hypothetical protein DMF95_15460 [Acidobacteriota bacterium]
MRTLQMRSVFATCLGLAVVSLLVALEGGAQERPAPTATTNDPRVGLKAGPTPPERDPNLPPLDPNAPPDPRFANMLAFANSDLAFSGNHLFMGSFHGFNTYDIERPGTPKLSASVVCPGGQGDVSVHGNLLFMSVEQTRGRLDCGVQGVSTPVSAERFRGVRIFDIGDMSKPRQVAAIQTCRGSHTHTLVTDPRDTANLYVYGSGTGSVRSAEELAGCSGLKPDEDPNTALFSIDVIQVPLAAPQNARIVNRPRIFADVATGAISGLWAGGDHGPGTQKTSVTNQCHDITVFPEVGLAAGACSGNGILLDISDPKNPVRLDHVVDKNFAYWHSATFNNDGTKVIFTDEWGGGTRPRCRATDLLTWGADAIFDIVDRKLRFGGYYKMPAAQSDTENCVAHNGSLIPVPGRDIMSQAWYQGGVSVFDFTDSAKPVEIAFFDRGPIDAKQLITGGYWSTYWYNGNIYGSEIARGIDVFSLTPSEQLSQNEIDAAMMVRVEELNTQQQTRVVWPPSAAVARAYVDQLTRSHGIQPERARAVRTALDRADGIRTGKERGAVEVLDQLDALAAQLESDAAAAAGRDAVRLGSLAAAIKGRTAKLR